MSDEAFDMQGGSTPAVAPEPAQPELPKEFTQEAAVETATPEAEAPAPEEGTRSAKRIREVIAERDHYKELAGLASGQPSASNNQAAPLDGESTDEATQFQQLVRKAISDEVSDIRQGLKLQAAEREIDSVKAQFSDFDDYVSEVREVLESNKTLRSSANPIRDAYFMAKGMSASQAVKAAKDAGREEAYKTITQKGQSAVPHAAPRTSNDPDQALMEKYRAGTLTEQERKAYWPKIVNAMSAEK